MDDPILSALKFPQSAIDLLPPRAIAYLSSSETRDGDPTFWQHFKSSNRSLIIDDRAMVSFPGNDLATALQLFAQSEQAPADPGVRATVSRVIAAEIDHWIRRDILGLQDVLMDAPHLQLRTGFRSPENEPTLQDFGATVRETSEPFGLEPQFFENLAVKSRFESDFWLPRDGAFWWPEIEKDEQYAAAGQYPRLKGVVFCEDVRTFEQTGEHDEVGKFVPEGGKPWLPRFVRQLTGFNYSPRSLLFS